MSPRGQLVAVTILAVTSCYSPCSRVCPLQPAQRTCQLLAVLVPAVVFVRYNLHSGHACFSLLQSLQSFLSATTCTANMPVTRCYSPCSRLCPLRPAKRTCQLRAVTARAGCLCALHPAQQTCQQGGMYRCAGTLHGNVNRALVITIRPINQLIN